MSQLRQVKQIIKGMPASDGAGVQLTRIIGTPYLEMLDPFLLLDAFGSDKPQDYIAGFPPHPHRGFETVTYMLDGKMRHKDSAGNEGVIEAGGVQWMTAGSGIIHSEMPEQDEGRLAGFQLWVNLPASRKMTAPKYQEKNAAEIPEETRQGDTHIKVVAGNTTMGTKGVIENSTVEPIYWDIHLQQQHNFTDKVPSTHNAFIYVIEGEVKIGEANDSVEEGYLAILDKGDQISIQASKDSRFLLIAGKPLNEPIARGGPFVMNTQQELNQAFVDYQKGTLIQA